MNRIDPRFAGVVEAPDSLESLRWLDCVSGGALIVPAPAGGWTVDLLFQLEPPAEMEWWEAWLGARWVGSSEC